MNKIRKWTAVLLTVALCVSLLTVSAGAYTRVDTEQKGTLELSYYDSERSFALKGMQLRLYKVADMSDTVRFTLTGDFAPASVSLEDMDAAKWTALAGTLSAYVAAADPDITPAATGTVGEDGKVKFEDIGVGLYLLDGDQLSSGGYTYTPTAFLMAMPTLNTENDQWVFDITAENKFTRTGSGGGGGGDTVARNVMKVWEGDEGIDRPNSVTVQLLQNGNEYATVVLSEANKWQHSWPKLPDGYNWQLVEVDVPEDYTVLVEQTGNTYVVTNTYTIPIDDDPPPGGGVVPPGGDDTPPEEEIPEEEPPLGGLPKTGVAWWPVPILAAAGLFMLMLGMLDSRRGKKQQDA